MAREIQGSGPGGAPGSREVSLPASLPLLPALTCGDSGQAGSTAPARAPENRPKIGDRKSTQVAPFPPASGLEVQATRGRDDP